MADLFEGTISDMLAQGAQSFVQGVQTPLSNMLTSPSGNHNPFALGRQLKPEYTCYITCADLGINFTAALPPDFDWSVEAEYDSPLRDVLGDAVSTVSSKAPGIMRGLGMSLVTQALTAKFWAGSSTGPLTLPLILQAETDEVKDVMQPLLQLLSLSMPRLSGETSGLLQAPGPQFSLTKLYDAAKVPLSNQNSLKGVLSVAGNIVNSSVSKVTDAVKGVMSDGKLSNAGDGLIAGGKAAVGALLGVSSDLADSGLTNRISLRIGNYIQLPSVVIKSVSQKHILQPVGLEYGKSSGNIQRIELQVTFEPFMDLTQNDLKDIFINPKVAALAASMVSKKSGFSMK